MDTLSLSTRDRHHVVELNKKLQVVRDRVAGVATGRHTGFFVGGRGGIGKSHTVCGELERRGTAFKLWNSAMTARCLFDRLAAYPEAIHVIEDIEGITRDRRAIGVLRSSLWGSRRGRDGRMERLVTWNAKGACDDFIFSGGIIMTANRRLAELPELDALKTRISWMNLSVSDAEIAALMRNVAAQGYGQDVALLEPAECLEIIEFIVTEAERVNCRLDMRLLVNSIEDRLLVEDLEAGCDWKDLVAARIRERPTVVGDIEPVGVREEKRDKQLRVAREIAELEPESRLKVWQEKTGASRATLYRRLGELARLDALDVEF